MLQRENNEGRLSNRWVIGTLLVISTLCLLLVLRLAWVGFWVEVREQAELRSIHEKLGISENWEAVRNYLDSSLTVGMTREQVYTLLWNVGQFSKVVTNRKCSPADVEPADIEYIAMEWSSASIRRYFCYDKSGRVTYIGDWGTTSD